MGEIKTTSFLSLLSAVAPAAHGRGDDDDNTAVSNFISNIRDGEEMPHPFPLRIGFTTVYGVAAGGTSRKRAGSMRREKKHV